ncbi:MAG: protease modulator HflC [Spirochaetia bacterium]
MKRTLITLAVIIGIAVVFVLLGPFYIVEEGQQAVVTRFGRIVAVSTDAGLKFKIPVVDNVRVYSKRLLSWDGERQRLPTSENQFIWVDTTARWRIDDPQLFYESVTTEQQGYARLDDVIDSAVRTVVARNELREAVRNSNLINEIEREMLVEQQDEDIDVQEIEELTDIERDYEPVSKGREQLSQEMFEAASELTPEYGIELEDIIIRQIRYSEDLTESVYNRMIKERNQIASAYRSYGEGMRAEWVGKLQNEKQKIISGAYKESETIKGRADAEASQIYAEAYTQDEDFFEFWRSIESYRRVLPNFEKTLSTEMDYFRYLYGKEGSLEQR